MDTGDTASAPTLDSITAARLVQACRGAKRVILARVQLPFLKSLYTQMKAADENPRQAQEDVYARIRARIPGTAVGDLQSPRIWENLESFRAHVRPTSIADYQAHLEQGLREPKSRGRFEHGPTRLWTPLSNTALHAPVTESHLESFKGAALRAIAEMAVGQKLNSALEGKILVIGNPLPAARATRRNMMGAEIGNLAALLLPHAPPLLKRRVLSSSSSLRETLLKEKPEIVCATPDRGVASIQLMLSSDPTPLTRFALKKISVWISIGPLDRHHLHFLTEHLPQDCRILTWIGGVEGPVGFSVKSSSNQFRMALQDSLFLFEPKNSQGRRLLAWELRPGEDYEILISSLMGFMAYRTGMKVKLTSALPLEFRLLPEARLSKRVAWVGDTKIQPPLPPPEYLVARSSHFDV